MDRVPCLAKEFTVEDQSKSETTTRDTEGFENRAWGIHARVNLVAVRSSPVWRLHLNLRSWYNSTTPTPQQDAHSPAFVPESQRNQYDVIRKAADILPD